MSSYEISCPKCGNVYRITFIKAAIRKEGEQCECGNTIILWNGGNAYPVSLQKRGGGLHAHDVEHPSEGAKGVPPALT